MDIKFLSQNTLIKLLYQWEKNYSREKGTGGRINKSNSRKGCHDQSDPYPDQFLSNILTLPKKDGGNRSVINLKKLNNFIHSPHFKIKGLFLVRELLLPKRLDV